MLTLIAILLFLILLAIAPDFVACLFYLALWLVIWGIVVCVFIALIAAAI